MIIGVGNIHYTWMDGMGIGILRTPGGIHVRVPNARLAVKIHHARRILVQQCGKSMYVYSNSRCFLVLSLTMLDRPTSFSTCETDGSGRAFALWGISAVRRSVRSKEVDLALQ